MARWASQCRIGPEAVDDSVIERFIAELEAASLIRNIRNLHRSVATSWNSLVRLQSGQGLQTVEVPTSKPAPTRVPWEHLPASFRADVDRHLAWCAMPDPLDENARARALAPRTLHLRRDHIHSAVTAAVAAGVAVQDLTSLANLVEIETFKALMRHRWEEGGRALTAYTHGVAGTLIAIAAEWVKAPADTLATLKALRRKLGTLPSGLTEKNKVLLRKFDDPRLLEALIQLPDRLWRRARRDLATSRRPFIDLQSALAIDLLLHVPLRMENLAALNFEEHLHWPQGRGKPALVVFGFDETKNDIQLEYEIPTALAERLQVYRNEIAPAVTGKRPDAVFVTWARQAENARCDHDRNREDYIETSRRETDSASVPASRRENHPRCKPGSIRVGAADARPQEHEDDHKFLCWDRHPAGRTRSRRPHHETQEIRDWQKARSSNNGVGEGQGLVSCPDLNRDYICPTRSGPQPTGSCGSAPWAATIPSSDAAGSRLAKTSQHQYLFAWRRFLGFLAIEEPWRWNVAPAERLTIERIRQFVCHLAETNTPRSVAIQVDALYKAARVDDAGT